MKWPTNGIWAYGTSGYITLHGGDSSDSTWLGGINNANWSSTGHQPNYAFDTWSNVVGTSASLYSADHGNKWWGLSER